MAAYTPNASDSTKPFDSDDPSVGAAEFRAIKTKLNTTTNLLNSALVADPTNPSLNQLAASTGSSLVGFIQTGAGATSRTILDKDRERINVRDFLPAGYATTGAVDYYTQLQLALNEAGNRGGAVVELDISLYCSSSITVPANVTLEGACESIGSSRGNYAVEYATPPSLRLSNTATIILSRGSVVKNLFIINANALAALPLSDVTTALAVVAAYAGIAISGDSVEDVYIHNCRIIGFAQAIKTNLCDRIKLEWLDIDCTAGIWTNDVYDISRLYKIHMWPFLTYGYSFSTTNLLYYRSGSGFKITGHFDGCTIVDSFTYGYFTGFDIQATTGILLEGCWVEGGGASYIAGQSGYKFSVAGDQTNLIGCGVDTCDFGVYVNYAGIKLGISGCMIHANKTGIQVVSAVDVSINDNHFYYPHAAGAGAPVAWIAPQAAIYLSAVGGQVSITNNYVYGSGLIDGAYLVNIANNSQIIGNKFINCINGISVDGTCTGEAVITGNSFNATSVPYNSLSAVFTAKLTMHSNIGLTVDTIGNLYSNLLGQPAATYTAFGGGNGPRYINNYATGTPSVPALVSASATLVSYRAFGHDGAAFRAAGLIRIAADGTPSAGNMPGTFIVSTTLGGTVSPIDRNSTGNDGTFKPLTDNTYQLGMTGFRWSSVWAANGTIQTSDSRTKTEIADSVLGLAFINALRPVSYKMIEGGKKVIRQRYYDAAGVEFDVGAEVPADATPGEIITESIPGIRTHFGLLSQEVKAAIDAAGIDFGGWILTDTADPNSQQALRYDEFISPLIKAIQELTAKVAALEAKN